MAPGDRARPTNREQSWEDEGLTDEGLDRSRDLL